MGAPTRLGERPDRYPEFRPRADTPHPSRARQDRGRMPEVNRMEPLRRIAAYGVCRNPDGHVLLVRASASTGTPGAWSLPGGAVAHGEDPRDTVVRETAAETGLSVAVERLVDVRSDVRALPRHGVAIHTDRLLYEVAVRGGTLRDRVDRPTDLARFVRSEAR